MPFEQYYLPIFLIVAGLNLLGVGHRVTNIIAGICALLAGLVLVI